MFHICAALAAAIALFLAFIAMGVAVMSGLAALLAAGLVAWIVYRVTRNALAKKRAALRFAQDRARAASGRVA
jgi:F0F1-type ATP synthase assembly protein I